MRQEESTNIIVNIYKDYKYNIIVFINIILGKLNKIIAMKYLTWNQSH